VQAEIYKERFQHLKIPGEKIAICGNIKADEAFNALAHLPPDREILNFLKIRKNAHNEKKIVTIASSHLHDEKLVIPIINKLRQDFLFIIVPRHPKRVEEIEKLLKNHQVSYSTWSKISNTSTWDNVLIFDRMGYLFNILKITDIVFMGGTLEPKIGGHNLYEPAVMGKLIVGGPYYNNFPAIGAELIEKKVYNILKSAKELSKFLRHIKKINFKDVERDAIHCVTRRKGSIQCTLKEIQKLIN
jgi:3-deoxy-D-manno-octulosonic-acid transferase